MPKTGNGVHFRFEAFERPLESVYLFMLRQAVRHTTTISNARTSS
jgi:hypothetical protein